MKSLKSFWFAATLLGGLLFNLNPPAQAQTNAYDDAYAHAQTLAAGERLVFVHPFDDPDVIAGQGTIAAEILRQFREPIEALFVPVGGGGLASGIALYVKALYPGVRVIGVEAEESPSMQRSLEAGAPVTLEHVGIFADGMESGNLAGWSGVVN